MDDIRFECPNCKQHLNAPGELANQLIECPGCKQTIAVPIRNHLEEKGTQRGEQPRENATVAQQPQGWPPGTVALVVVFCLYMLTLVEVFHEWRVDELTQTMGGANLTGEDEPNFGPVIWLIVWGVIGLPIGFLAGRMRGKQRLGAAWGLALGPMGWFITVCTADLRARCPECRGVIAEGARRCMHCGVSFNASAAP